MAGRGARYAVKPLVGALTPAGFAWLAAGGLFYTLGIVFYALDETLRHGHGIWHLFVLAGSVSHYVALLLYVARTDPCLPLTASEHDEAAVHP